MSGAAVLNRPTGADTGRDLRSNSPLYATVVKEWGHSLKYSYHTQNPLIRFEPDDSGGRGGGSFSEDSTE